MTRPRGSDAIADIIAALELYSEAIDISALDEQEQKALKNILTNSGRVQMCVTTNKILI